MKARVCLLFLACAVALFASSASATAKPGYFKSPAFRYVQADLPGTHGYRLQISAIDLGVSVAATKGYASVNYFLLHSRLRGERIEARLPGVGWVFLRFHELRRSHRPPADNCRGPATLIRHGVFEGQVRIKGERGYTSANARRVRGKIVSEPRNTCRRRANARTTTAADQAEQFLYAQARRGRGDLSFWADRWPPSQGINTLFFNASLHRRRGPMVIINSNYAFTEDAETFAVAKPARSAAVDPPDPFTGTATFQQESKDEFSWSGDLAVELPGIGEVALTGPKFESSLCIGRHCRGDVDESEGSIVALQGSGSHSQPLAEARLSSLR